jgi:hypothetical protein
MTSVTKEGAILNSISNGHISRIIFSSQLAALTPLLPRIGNLEAAAASRLDFVVNIN